MGGATHVLCPLRAAAIASPGAPAVIGANGTLSYSELDRRVSATEKRIASLGSEDRVTLYLPKDERYLVLLLALIRAGFVACPLSTRLPPGGVPPLLEQAACGTLISEDDEITRAVDGIRELHPEDLLEDKPGRGLPSEPLPLALNRPATIVFTSGSTGDPKAALHTFGNHYFSALGSNINIALAPGDCWLHSLPLYHVGGLAIVFRCLLAGATLALPEPGASLGEAITGGVTHCSLVSTQLLRLLAEAGFESGGLKAILLGGSKIPPSLVDEAVERGLPIHTSYGLTEMASQVTTTPPLASREVLRTSGRPLPHRKVSISEAGEIMVRGETLFSGYVERGVVVRPLDADGWFHTGDLGELDAGGYLTVGGRKDNLFDSGGENVQPEEIEEALCRLEGVEEAVVVPISDATFGFRPVAFVRTAGGAVQPEALARALELALPRFKIPVAFHSWIQEAAGMKLDRASFRERARRLHRGDQNPT